MLEELRAVGVPGHFFCTTFFYPALYHETIRHSVRGIRHNTEHSLDQGIQSALADGFEGPTQYVIRATSIS